MFAVGSRVRDADGFRATVRYIGPVAAAKNKTETWLGVEWDDKTRGKHDGSCVDENNDYHRYFECVNGAGSFVKHNKVTAGRSFMEALNERYVQPDAPVIAETDATLPNVFVSTLKGNQKSVEFVGEKQLRKWQQISSVSKVSIMNDTVSFVDTAMGDSVAHLVEVDLQDNLIHKWSEISLLGSQLPQLQVLLLHGNRMEALTEEIVGAMNPNCLSGLRVLALNGCSIRSWQQLQMLEPFLPSLEELYVANNQLCDLPRSEAEKEYEAATGNVSVPVDIVHGFPRLRVLDVSGCGLVEWSQVLALGKLPSLQELVLDRNMFARVTPAVEGLFPSLVRFSLHTSGLEAWSDIDHLASYLSVRTLRLSQIPLFVGKGASEVRPIVVARFKQLAFFNGSQISVRERTDAERAYLRAIMQEKTSALKTQSPEEVEGLLASAHPRFRELQALHGADVVEPAKDSAAKADNTIASELLNITFRNFSFGSNGSLEPIAKKLPKSLSVARLRLMVKQLFGLEPRLQQLSMRLYKDSVPFVLDDDASSLEYFGAIDGAVIFINEAKNT